MARNPQGTDLSETQVFSSARVLQSLLDLGLYDDFAPQILIPCLLPTCCHFYASEAFVLQNLATLV
jgi:hypothetical protein